MKFTVTAPDGQKFTVNAPEGATQDQVLQFAQQQFQRRASDAADMKRLADPTSGNSFLDNAVIGAGKAVADLGRGAGQYLGLVSREDVAEARKLDKPLMDTAGGKVGNIAGNVAMLAPTALIPGANTYTGAATIGAISGALQPSESTGETLTNIGLGGAGGLAGQKLANVAGNYVAKKTAESAAKVAANAQKAGAAKQAMDAGYVIPPKDLGSANAVSGLAGKIQTAQHASARNQSVTNELVKRELGIAADAPLDAATLKGIRAQAGQAYDAVASSGQITPGPTYDSALDAIIAPFKKASAGFPNAKPNPIIQEIDSLRSPQFDAAAAIEKIKELRNSADGAYASGNKQAGKAFKDAAGAVEDAIDRHLQSIGAPPDLLNNFRGSRQLIAKTYSVEKALNTQTGDVSAQVLARDLARGKPLSGGLKTAAEAGRAFPDATQALKGNPTQLSPLDYGAGLIGLAGSGGNPLAAAGLVARPAARAALLSGPVQRNALAAMSAPQRANALARLLQHEEVALPAGVLSGGALANYLAQQ